MNSHLDLLSFADPAQWPRCPECGSRDLLVSGRRYYCLEKPHTGPLTRLRGKATQYALAHSLFNVRPNLAPDGGPPDLQFGPFPQAADPEFGHVLRARRIEALLDQSALPLLEKAAAYRQKFGAFPTTELRFKRLEVKPEARPVALTEASVGDPPELASNLRAAWAAGHDAYARLRAFTSEDNVQGIQATLECYGAPARHYAYRTGVTSPAGEPELTSILGPAETLYQPIGWGALHVDDPNFLLRYAAGVEARGGVNATLAVTENLDTYAHAATVSLRQPGHPAIRSTKRLGGESVEEAVERARAYFRRLVDKIDADTQVFSFEREFGPERSGLSIVGELQGLELWEAYAGERTLAESV